MGAALASYEEAFRITAHESHAEVLAQTRRKARSCHPITSGTRQGRRRRLSGRVLPGPGGASGAGASG
ncbi:hypothetical protein SHKM778_09850 [Streptomyces sp. KM77-8]|uniref:Uncharacterized protein n=1 Tax=Streptomyces haneummycinicus TaxID=3074435 RepID=A0AAT9HB32_9ACTN